MEVQFLTVGKIVNTHGVRGELKIIPQTDFPEVRFAKGSVLYAFPSDGKPSEALKVLSSRYNKGTYIVNFEQYNDINEVLRLKGATLKVSADQSVDLEDDEYYYHEIVGCEVVSEVGDSFGKVTGILSPGANDVWVVERPNGKELLIPVIDDVVKHVDISAKRITIHVMEGLLEA